MALCGGGAAAQALPDEGGAAGAAAEDTAAALAALRARIDVLEAEGDRAAAERDAALRLLADAGALLDSTRPLDERRAAAAALGDQGVEALPFLLAAARLEGGSSAERRAGSAAELAVAAVEAMASVRDPAVVRYAGAVLEASLGEAVRLASVSALVRTGRPEAGAVLWDAAADRSLPRAVRRAAAAAVEQHFPEVVAQRGAPGVVSDPVGLVAGLAANSAAGGVVLSSVGVWGRSDAAVVIGAVGGAAIGLGTGALYTAREPVSAGSGLRYASGVSWGLVYGMMGQPVLGTEDLARETSGKLRALYRTVGVGGGAAAGLLLGQPEPSVGDVLEVDLAGYLGMMSGIGAGMLLSDDRCLEEPGAPGEYAAPECDWAALYDRRYHSQWRGGAAGLTAGLAAGALARDTWELGRGDLGFGATSAAEIAWISGWLPTALRADEPDGNVLLGLHAGAAAGLAAAHFVPRLSERTPLVAWGVLTGNALGAGVPLLAGSEDGAVISRVMLPAGAAAAAAGGVLAPAVRAEGGDIAMIGVGTGLVSLEALSIGWVLDERLAAGAWDEDRSAGLVLAAGGASGIGFTALSQAAAPRAGDMLFLGSAAAWGAWYGALTPIGLRLEGGLDDLLVSTTVTGDAFLLLGGLALLPPLSLDPQRTLLAQLGGVGGATMGALGVAMASADGSDVALGAVIGSAVGLAGGGVAAALIGERELDVAALLPRPRLRLPGSWSATLLPAPAGGGGEAGWMMRISVSEL